MTEAVRKNLQLGTKMADGSVFAGLTADGCQQIYAMPTDLGVTSTFNEAAACIKQLNTEKYLGHDDWQMPTVEQERVMQQNQDKGALKGTFTKKAGWDSDYPDWYWSSTEISNHPDFVHGVHFAGGEEAWSLKESSLLSCRPVRLVSVSAKGT